MQRADLRVGTLRQSDAYIGVHPRQKVVGMIETVELEIDVTDVAGVGPAHTAVSVVLPDPEVLADPPVLCFAFPGGGYSRRYYTFDMPGDQGGGEAGFHAAHGWIFVAVDHLGFGDATMPEGDGLTYESVALGNMATVEHVRGLLRDGTLMKGFPRVTDPATLGIGQSMGGCFTIVLQAHHGVFDGIASLGFSGRHTNVPSRPGGPKWQMPWLLRNSDVATAVPLNTAALASFPSEDPGENPFRWAFHWEDVPPEVVAADMESVAGGNLPPWRSATTPSCGIFMVTPGTIASEAASITVPVLLAMGERDVIPDPWLEPLAFSSSTDITLYVCPRMAHMHNFASTRHRFWSRIQSWGTGVATARNV